MKKFLLMFMLFSVVLFSETTYVSKVVLDERGIIIEEENMKVIHPLASLTKMVTALIVMDNEDKGLFSYDEMVVVSRKAATIGGSSSGLRMGDKISVEDLMKALIVRSGNDAAYTLAEFIAGSEDEFVNLMNEKASELGLEDTIFHTCTGLPTNMTGKKLDVSTAYDMAHLSREVLNYSEYMKWASLKKIKIKNGRSVYSNRNRLIGSVEGVDGLKTGHHSVAKYNIAISAKRDDMRLIFVVLGSADENIRDREVKAIIEDIYSRYEFIKIASKGDLAVTVPIEKSKERKISLYLSDDIYAVVEKGGISNVKKSAIIPEVIEAPIGSGDGVGTLSVNYRGKKIAEASLLSDINFEELPWFRKLIRVITFNKI